MKNRVIFGLFLVAAIFYAPWWVVFVLALAGAFLWSPYYEIIGFGFLFDILYGTTDSILGGILGLAAAVAVFYAGAYLKKIVR